VYKVDTDAIALKVKQEFAARDRKQMMKADAAKAPLRTTKKAKVA
jgi:ParB family chromosome partitioning protein